MKKVILGTMRWGEWGENLSTFQVVEIVEKGLDFGFDTLDLADIYGGYTTESLVGKALAENSLCRDDFKLITKCGIKYPCQNSSYALKSYDLSKSYIIQQAEQSLKNLRTDYLDVLLIHRPSPLMNPFEIAAAFQYLQQCGKVKHFGVSNFTHHDFANLNGLFPLVTNQIEFSALENSALYDNTLQQSIMLGLQPMAWSPLGGYFSSESESVLRLRPVLQELKEKYAVTEDLLLLAWVQKHPSNCIPVVGTSKIDRIKALSALDGFEMEDDDWFKILEASTGQRVP